MTEISEPLVPCSDCGFLKGVSRLRPFGPNYSLICAECAFKTEDAYDRTMGIVHELASDILGMLAVDDDVFAVVAIEVPIEIAFGVDENDNLNN